MKKFRTLLSHTTTKKTKQNKNIANRIEAIYKYKITIQTALTQIIAPKWHTKAFRTFSNRLELILSENFIYYYDDVLLSNRRQYSKWAVCECVCAIQTIFFLFSHHCEIYHFRSECWNDNISRNVPNGMCFMCWEK